jgi:small subunit ribosomal protein S6
MVPDKVSEESKQLRDYEMVLVISPEVAEEEFEAAIGNVSQLITDKGGTISDIERWGKRRLAYPIRHFVEGNYVLTRFRLGPAHGKELEANLRISEEVLRHLVVKLDGQPEVTATSE